MSAMHDLIGQFGDPSLRERLAAEWQAASTGKKFGLVFEDHLPELLPLPKAKPRRGGLVCRRMMPHLRPQCALDHRLLLEWHTCSHLSTCYGSHTNKISDRL